MKSVPERFVKDCITLAHKRTSSGESLASVISSLIYDVYAMGATIGAAAEREACAKVCEDSVEYAGDTLAQAIRARGRND